MLSDAQTGRSLYLIAGEASGDFIGSELIHALRAREPDLAIHGIGGELMCAAGLSSLFPMQELSLMGFLEILPHIRRLKRRIRETIADIQTRKPDIIVSIDSPGFNFRVVKALRVGGFNARFVHYVAPTVWAYKPERAAKTATLYDKLLTILPFEPPYFEAEGLRCDYVGHPVIWSWRNKGDGAAFRTRHGIVAGATLVGLMPGSRRGEILRHLPVLRATCDALRSRYPALQVMMPVRVDMGDFLRDAVASWPCPVTLIEGQDEKRDAFAACQLLIAKSGTVALEATLSSTPTITIFKANPITIWMVRRMVRIPYAHLVNIIAWQQGKPQIIEELLQEQCTPERLTAEAIQLLENPAAQEAQRTACADIFMQMGINDSESPSAKAAQSILA